ncbi:hypothetical protein WJX75_003341 [Coccomyxa subellipsoidea]|uniref:Uncharacterized protein n=1 Tax=Coccomyxa subellipsoidea TaxID=248742 RepID=A0ABR2YRG7_9CHLO
MPPTTQPVPLTTKVGTSSMTPAPLSSSPGTTAAPATTATALPSVPPEPACPCPSQISNGAYGNPATACNVTTTIDPCGGSIYGSAVQVTNSTDVQLREQRILLFRHNSCYDLGATDYRCPQKLIIRCMPEWL